MSDVGSLVNVRLNKIHPSFVHGKNFKIGDFCIIEEDVVVGDNVKIGSYCHLRSGTRFGNNVTFADHCKTTGICYLGNNVNVRTDSCISKSVIVEDNAFIGAGVMSSHTRFPAHMRTKLSKDMGRQYITRIGYGALVGSCVCLGAGVRIGDYVIVGYGTVVVRDILERGIYVGIPPKRIGDVPEGWVIPKPKNYKEYQFPKEMLEKYLPNYRG